MNPRKTTVAILAGLSVSLALAGDFKTINGKEYKNATVSRVEADGITIKFSGGILKVPFTELTEEVQQRFNYNPEKAAEYSANQNAALEQARKQQEQATQSPTQLSVQEDDKNPVLKVANVLVAFRSMLPDSSYAAHHSRSLDAVIRV